MKIVCIHGHTHETLMSLGRCLSIKPLDPDTGRPMSEPDTYYLWTTPPPTPVKGSSVPTTAPARAIPTPAPPAPATTAGRKYKGDPDDPASPSQLDFIRDLGGSYHDSKPLNKEAASTLIDLLKTPAGAAFKIPEDKPLHDEAWEAFPLERAHRLAEDARTEALLRAAAEKTESEARKPVDIFDAREMDEEAERRAAEEAKKITPEDVRTVMRGFEFKESWRKTRIGPMAALMDHVPDGYYALDMGDGKHNDLKFFRVSRPKKGHYAGAIKVQWQTSDNLEDVWARWPGGRVSVFVHWIEDYILGLISGHMSAARRYAKEIDRCARCNKTLTDERSRHYGIGPECEKYWGWMIEAVDLEDAEEKGK